MLLVAFIYAFTSSLDGLGVKHSGNNLKGAIFWTLMIDIFSSLILAYPAYLGWKATKQKPKHIFKILAPVGICKGIAEILQMWAMVFTMAVYVNSVKRTCIIMSVIIGHKMFKEEGIKERLIGAVIMTAGIILIFFSSI